MQSEMAAYMNACEQGMRWQIERSKLAQKAAEVWYDSLTPDQQAVFLKFAENKEILAHVQMRTDNLRQEEIRRTLLERAGSSANGAPAH